MSAASTNVGNLSSTLTLHVEADPSEMDKLVDAMEQGQRKLEQRARERASSSAFLPDVLSPSESIANEQRIASARKTERIIATVRQQETDAQADREIASANKTAKIIAEIRRQQMQALRREERQQIRDREVAEEVSATRMSQLLSDDGFVTGIGGRRMSAAERRNAASASSARAARLGGVFQETGRGIEDFLVSFSMAKTTSEGLAMGLRGSANNMAQLASYAGPLTGGLVAIGASLATIIVPKVIEWAYEVKSLSKEQDELLRKYLKTQEVLAGISGGKSAEQKMNQLAEDQATQVRLVARLQKKLQEETQSGTAFNDPRMVKLREALVAAGDKAEDARLERQQIREEHGVEMAVEFQKEKNERIAKENEEAWDLSDKLFDQQAEKQKEFDDRMAKRAKDTSTMLQESLQSDIDDQEAAVGILQDRVSRAGNPNGPSSALIRGSSAAESAINRAVAGSASQENTLKASLKVQQDQLKELRKQKQSVVAGL